MSAVAGRCDVRIAEYFLSLQGEGPSVGVPAHFVRLQGCSVGCRWCDTKYTWDVGGGEPASFEQLSAALDSLGRSDLLVITGGEPLENPNFDRVVEWGSSRWARVEVETSGSRPPPAVPANVHWNWSPKLSGVTPNAESTWSHHRDFARSERSVCKVVVDDEHDWEEAVRRVASTEFPRGRVLIMPQGMQANEIRERARWLAPLCIEQGFRLTTRFHVELWGAKKGV